MRQMWSWLNRSGELWHDGGMSQHPSEHPGPGGQDEAPQAALPPAGVEIATPVSRGQVLRVMALLTVAFLVGGFGGAEGVHLQRHVELRGPGDGLHGARQIGIAEPFASAWRTAARQVGGGRRRIALETVAEASAPRWVSRPVNLSSARSSAFDLELKGSARQLLGALWPQAPWPR